MIALIPSLGWQEMFLLLVIGLLLYGRNLPEAGRSLGRVVAQLKRSFHDFKDQLDRDGELRDVKKAIQDTAREVKNVGRVPHAMSNPASALRELTHEAMSSPLPDDDSVQVDPGHFDPGQVDGEHLGPHQAGSGHLGQDGAPAAETAATGNDSDSTTADKVDVGNGEVPKRDAPASTTEDPSRP